MKTPAFSPLQRHRLDLEAIEAGKWITIKGDKFLVASYSAKAVAAARAEAMRELGLDPAAEVPPHQAEFVNQRVFCKAVLLDGKVADTEWSPVIAESIFTDPELVQLRNAIINEAFGDYTKDAVAKAARVSASTVLRVERLGRGNVETVGRILRVIGLKLADVVINEPVEKSA